MKLNPDEICPCGTELLYKDCCWEKDFEWTIDDNGNTSRTVPLNFDARQALDNLEKEFINIFGREPYESDPVFLIKYLHNEDDLEHETIRVMHQTGISPELIYAYEKTGGLLISESNQNKVPTKDLEEWNEAIEEYFYLQDNPPEEDPIITAGAEIINDLKKLIMVFGYILECGTKEEFPNEHTNTNYISTDEYILICSSKSFKTLRAIKLLLDNNIGSDSLALARSIYESYLHIVFVKAKPEKVESLFASQLGIKSGTHAYAKNSKGGIDKRKIVRIKDGEIIDGHISMFRMASSSAEPFEKEIFDGLYEFLSEFSHTGLSYLTNTDSIEITNTELQFEAVFYTCTFSVLILDQIKSLSILTSEARKDLKFVTKAVSKNLLTFLEVAFSDTSTKTEISMIKTRLQLIFN